MSGGSHQSNCNLVRYLDRSIKIDFLGDEERSRGRSISNAREGSLLKRGRLRQKAGEGYTRSRKFEQCSGLEDSASQNWWQGRQTQRGGRQFRVVGFWRFQNASSMDEFFVEQNPRKFYACTQTTNGESSRTTKNRW